MADGKNVNIKLEIYRDKGKLSLLVRFDNEADNFIVEKDNYSWLPTIEEIELINEAFGVFSKDETKSTAASPEKIIEKHLEKPIEDKGQDKEEDAEENKIIKIQEEKIAETDNGQIENTIKKHEREDREKDELLKEADEHTIIDKVLSQKKKGRWKKL